MNCNAIYIVDFDYYLLSEIKRGKVTEPKWFKCPTSPSPRGWQLIHGHPNGLQHLGIWQLLQGWAVRHHQTGGRFQDDSGEAMTTPEIAGAIGLDEAREPDLWEALSRIAKVGWIRGLRDSIRMYPENSAQIRLEEKRRDTTPTNHAHARACAREAEAIGDPGGVPDNGVPGGFDIGAVGVRPPEWPAVVSACERWKGAGITVSEDSVLWQYAIVLAEGPAVEIAGSGAVDSIVLLQRAISNAIESSAPFHTMRGAIAYLKGICERCMREQCWPGQFDNRSAGAKSNGNHISRIPAKPGKYAHLGARNSPAPRQRAPSVQAGNPPRHQPG